MSIDPNKFSLKEATKLAIILGVIGVIIQSIIVISILSFMINDTPSIKYEEVSWTA